MVEATNVKIELGKPEWYEGSAQVAHLGAGAADAMRSLLRATLDNSDVGLRDYGDGWEIIVRDQYHEEFSFSVKFTDVLDDLFGYIWDLNIVHEEGGKERVLKLADIFEKAAAHLRELATETPPETQT